VCPVFSTGWELNVRNVKFQLGWNLTFDFVIVGLDPTIQKIYLHDCIQVEGLINKNENP
jgi:hypothetical protein